MLAACAAEVGQPELEVASAAITAQPDPSCTWKQYGGHDYWVCTASKTWQQARTICESVQMHLARPDDAAENEFVRASLSANAWIGGGDATTEGQWRWIDNNDPFWTGAANGAAQGGRYTRWTSGEPNNSFNEDCAEMRSSDGRWNDTQCGIGRAFVCESSAATASAPQAPDTACTRATRNGKTYWMCKNARSWDQARGNCQALGMDLAAIEDQAESDFVKSRITVPTHFGFSDAEQEQAWRWSYSGELGACGNGAAGSGSAYTRWAFGQPRSDALSCRKFDGLGKTYYLCDDPRKWSDARAQCAGSKGMSLARIDSAAENALISSNVIINTWIGANDLAQEGNWEWVDGQDFWTGGVAGTPAPGQYAHWRAGEPNSYAGSDEDCAAIDRTNTQWNDEPCECALCINAWVCEGERDTGVPDTNDCAYLDSSAFSSEWYAGRCAEPRGYVCESLPAGQEHSLRLDDVAEDVDQDFGADAPRVKSAQLEGVGDLTRLFKREQDRLGLRACVDSLEPTGETRTLPALGLEEVTYEQRYNGVPVYGRGYFARRDPASGQWQSLGGRTEPNLAVPTAATVSRSAALATAVGAFGGTASSYDASSGKLYVFPITQGRKPQWELAWLFSLPPRGTLDGHDVAVSARDGRVIQSLAHKQAQCAHAALPAQGTTTTVTVTAYPQQIEWSDPDQLRVVDNATNLTHPYLMAGGLASNDTTWPPMLNAYCGADRSGVMSLQGDALNVSSSSSNNEQMAAMLLGLQTCLDVVASELQWMGMDGAGLEPLDVVFEPSSIGPHFDPNAEHLTFVPHGPTPPELFTGASIETACHEFAHAIFNRTADLRDRADGTFDSLESRTLNEGWADVLGSAVEMIARGTNHGYPGPGGFCFAGDESLNADCLRNLVNPLLSTDPTCKMPDGSGAPRFAGCPTDYEGPDYCGSDALCGGVPGCCGTHRNSTVFSHWFYVVTTGQNGVNADQCPYQVKPLDPDLGKAVKKALALTHLTVTNFLDPARGYPGLADAMVEAAALYFDPASTRCASDPQLCRDNIESVANAWYAVNVRENFHPGANDFVKPPRGGHDVSPWTTFEWPAEGETKWDIEIYLEKVDGVPVFAESDIGRVITRNGVSYGQHKIAFTPRSVARYYWRVRPATHDGPWALCYPIHGFDSVGALNTHTQLDVKRNASGGVDPGEVTLLADAVDGAVEYELQISTTSIACTDTADDREIVEAPDGTAKIEAVFDELNVQPETTYHATVRAVGPKDYLTGDTQYGDCATFTFTTAKLPTPRISEPHPLTGTRFNFVPPHEEKESGHPLQLVFSGRGHPASYRLQLHRRNANGLCGPRQVTAFDTIAVPNCSNPMGDNYGTTACTVTIPATDLTNPWPGGYCWQVTSVAENGKTSDTASGTFDYYVEYAATLRPAGTHYSLAASGQPGAIGPAGTDSYDKDLEFIWSAVPNVLRYDIQHSDWPRASYGSELPAAQRTYPVAGGTSVVITDRAVSRGRYCYSVRPIFADPDRPGQQAAAQPYSFSEPVCYTTSGAKPTVTIDNNPNGAYTTAPITGRVSYAYAPDEQVKFDWSVNPASPSGQSVISWSAPQCTVREIGHFKDLFNCTQGFTINNPAKATEHKLRARTYNSNATSVPVMNDTSEVHDFELAAIETGDCGGVTETCCAQNPRCEAADALQCESNVCTDCGGLGEACCPGSRCLNAAHMCTNGTCQEPPPPGPMCNATVQAGGDDPETHVIELGKTSGITRFSWNTYTVGDILSVTYEGSEKENTLCQSTGTFVDGCIWNNYIQGPGSECNPAANPLPQGCGCCSGGQCWVDVRFSGQSSQMTVSVSPNCTAGNETIWDFSLSCP